MSLSRTRSAQDRTVAFAFTRAAGEHTLTSSTRRGCMWDATAHRRRRLLPMTPLFIFSMAGKAITIICLQPRNGLNSHCATSFSAPRHGTPATPRHATSGHAAPRHEYHLTVLQGLCTHMVSSCLTIDMCAHAGMPSSTSRIATGT